MTFGDYKTELSKGFIEYYGKLGNDNAYNFDIVLLSDGLTFDPATEYLKGKGSGIYLEMYSESPDELVSGTYTFDSESDIAQPFTFDDAEMSYNLDAETEESEADVEMKSGTVKLVKSGDIYEFTIEGTGKNGEKIYGYYKGTLDYYDFSNDKSFSLEKNILLHKK